MLKILDQEPNKAQLHLLRIRLVWTLKVLQTNPLVVLVPADEFIRQRQCSEASACFSTDSRVLRTFSCLQVQEEHQSAVHRPSNPVHQDSAGSLQAHHQVPSSSCSVNRDAELSWMSGVIKEVLDALKKNLVVHQWNFLKRSGQVNSDRIKDLKSFLNVGRRRRQGGSAPPMMVERWFLLWRTSGGTRSECWFWFCGVNEAAAGVWWGASAETSWRKWLFRSDLCVCGAPCWSKHSLLSGVSSFCRL